MTDEKLKTAIANINAYLSESPADDDTVTLTVNVIRSVKENYEELLVARAELDDLKRDTIPKLQSSLERANRYGLQLEEENKMFKAEFTRFAEEAAPPYLLINADAELTAEMIETLKLQKVSLVPDNEATVEFFNEASIKAEAVKEFAERLKGNKQLVKARLEDIGECLLYGVLCGDIDNLVKEMVGES